MQKNVPQLRGTLPNLGYMSPNCRQTTLKIEGRTRRMAKFTSILIKMLFGFFRITLLLCQSIMMA